MTDEPTRQRPMIHPEGIEDMLELIHRQRQTPGAFDLTVSAKLMHDICTRIKALEDRP